MSGATIYPQVTTYSEQTFDLTRALTDLRSRNVHAVLFEPIIQEDNAELVHHYILGNCAANNTWVQNRIGNPVAFGHAPANETDDDPCVETVWGWAPGVTSMALPQPAGILLGKPDQGFTIFKLQMHYNNINSVSGHRDSSGMRIWYTEKLRPNHVGMLQVGDPYVTDSRRIPPGLSAGQNQSHYEYSCPSWCTQRWPVQEINVFSSLLHMHEAGAQSWSSLWRNGAFVREIDRVDHYDFNFQTTVKFERLLKLQAGDRIHVHCVYDTSSRSSPTKFSLASQDEMCIDFLQYWPRIPDGSFCGYVDGAQGDDGTPYSGCGLHDDPQKGSVWEIRPESKPYPANPDPPSVHKPGFAQWARATCPSPARADAQFSTTVENQADAIGVAGAVFVLSLLLCIAAVGVVALSLGRRRRYASTLPS